AAGAGRLHGAARTVRRPAHPADVAAGPADGPGQLRLAGLADRDRPRGRGSPGGPARPGAAGTARTRDRLRPRGSRRGGAHAPPRPFTPPSLPLNPGKRQTPGTTPLTPEGTTIRFC